MHPNRRRSLPINAITSRSRSRRRIPSLEGLEERVVLSPTVYTVDSTADGTSKGTLRWAITQANANNNSAGSTIEFSSTVFSSAQTITLTDGSLDLTETAGPEVIQGPAVGVTINGNGTPDASVFTVGTELAPVDAAFSDLTVTGGNANTGGSTFKGGGIQVDGEMTLTDCTVEGNYAIYGGGISSYGGPLTLNDCTISGNTSRSSGGGIFCSDILTAVDTTISGNSSVNGAGGGLSDNNVEGVPRAMTLTGCTISGNSAPNDAGIYSANPATLTNCTISGNSASQTIGGVCVKAVCTFDACTISANSAGYGEGCGLDVGKYTPGVCTLEDTIVAGNTSGSPASPSDVGEGSSGLLTGSFNLIGPGGSAGIANGSSGNTVLTSLAGLELGPLANNGGATQTMALLPGSLAINNGTAISGLTTDQRGDPLDTPAPDIGAYQSQGYSWSVVAGSTPQSTTADSTFSDPLAVMLTQNGTNSPVPGTTVTFTVTPGSNGASAYLSAATAVSQSSGVASVTATAYNVAGSFTVTATAGNLAPITFNLTVTDLSQPEFSNLTAPTITYGTASVSLGGTIAAGSQIPSGKSVAVTLDGVTQNATIGNDGSFSAAFATTTLAASATPYTVSYVFDSEGNFEGASATSKLTVNKATALIVVTPYSSTYTGTAHSATGSATGVAGANLAADVNLSGTTHTNAGTYSDTWTFTDPTGNYANASGTITDTITKASATVNVTPYDVVYNAAAHSATATATGVAGVNLAADVNLNGTTHTNAGTYTDTWTFSDPSGNYANATGTVIDTISASQGPGSTPPAGSMATTTLVTGAGVSVFGQPAAVTVQVTANVTGAPVAAGTVELLVDGAVWATGTLGSTGQAIISTAGISVGAHSMVALYMGTASDAGSQSQLLAWRVNPAATSVLVSASPVFNKKEKVTSVNLLCQVEVISPGAGIPTGSITLSFGKKHRTTSMNLSNGETSIRLAAKKVKGQKIFVEYSGNAAYSASESPVLSGNSILSQRPGHAG